MQRKIAFCVGNWSADSTLFSWTYAKQYFLRKQRDELANETLSDLDKLYIVHVHSGKAKERWDAGGPILPRLSTALSNYPHTVVELEGRDTATAILDFAAREEIEILILGSREHKGAMQKMVPGVSTLGSTSDNVKARCRCPCLIIRPSAARNEKMRIKSSVNLGQLLESHQFNPEKSLPQPMKASVLAAKPDPEPRKVCIAFEHAESGNNITAWAAKHCLFPDDDIHLVHISNMSPLEKMQKSASFQKAMLKPKASEQPIRVENCDEVGLEELQGFEEPRRTRLKGDAKSVLCEYLDEKSVDLLVVGFSAANRFKKAFTGGSLSSHMLHHAPCPVVVLPLKSMAWEEQDTLSSLPETKPSHTAGLETHVQGLQDADGTSPPPLHSLGPRVSMSRSLSHQLSQAKDQMRRSVEGCNSPSTSPNSLLPPKGEVHRSLSGGSPPHLGNEPQGSNGLGRVIPPLSAEDPALPAAPRSPFQSVMRSTHSAEGAKLQAASLRSSFGSERQPSITRDEASQLLNQLEAKDAQISALQEEIVHLKFQLAALKGTSSHGRVMLPAS